MLCYIMLYYVILCYIILCYIILCYIISYIISYHSILYDIILYYYASGRSVGSSRRVLAEAAAGFHLEKSGSNKYKNQGLENCPWWTGEPLGKGW